MATRTDDAVFDAPAIAAIVTQFLNTSGNVPAVVVTNLGTSASCALKFQDSDDGSTWTDITGATATILPGASDGPRLISSVKRLIAIHAGGGMKIKVHVTRVGAVSPASLG